MKTSAIRKKLITYLADAEDKKVKALYILLEQEIKQKPDFKLSQVHVNILKKRATPPLGKESLSVWKDVHDKVKAKRTSK